MAPLSPIPLRFILAAALVSGVSLAGAAVKRPPARPPHTDHASFFAKPLADGPSVTRACLACHPDAAKEVMATAHWTWLSAPVPLPDGRREGLGKKNLINNFCIGIQGNWPRCTSCHAGYGWQDDQFNFQAAHLVDCLVCHEQTGGYRKGLAGLPEKDVDLLAAARSVARPTRQNCGSCHFNGGGGDAVKHGDLDQSLLHPETRIDVHMGGHGFQCVDCHQGDHHRMPGRAMSVSVDNANHLSCTQCHTAGSHKDERINSHERSVACQSCHVPWLAEDEGTKMSWDWSTAGDPRREARVNDEHRYKAIKGSFQWEHKVKPSYAWYNGASTHHILGERIDPAVPTSLAAPLGDMRDPKALIWPFKVHTGKQVYDTVHRTFHVPKTYGPGGFWTEFDWDKALRLGSQATGLPYSGSFGFAPTTMHWPVAHMVAEAGQALQCDDCHARGGRMDWKALGYPGDPARHGGRVLGRGGRGRTR